MQENIQEIEGLAKSIWGEQTKTCSLVKERTEDIVPEIIDFAEWTDVNYIIRTEKNNFDVSVFSGVKSYSSEKHKKYQHYRFVGTCIEIKGYEIKGKYCYLSGRPFKQPIGEGWIKIKENRKKIWIKEEMGSTEDVEKFCKLIQIIEKKICCFQSARYALYLREGTMRIIFWEPDKFLFEKQLRIYKIILEALCV